MMLAPLHDGGLLISTHAYAALTALVLGAFQLASPKGTPLHRNIGRLWVGLIGIVAISSFFINDIRQFGAFSLIHLLSLVTLYFLVQSMRAVRRGDIKTHQRTMKALYFYALILAGVFTLLPGRVMHDVLFS